MSGQASERSVEIISTIDLEDASTSDIRATIMKSLGYKPRSYVTKESLNSLFAYLDGEFMYDWEDSDTFSRYDMMLMICDRVREMDVEVVADRLMNGDNKLRKDELRGIAQKMKDEGTTGSGHERDRK